MTEKEIAEIESRHGLHQKVESHDGAFAFPEPQPVPQEATMAVIATLIAEVHRLRELFPDPEAEAGLLEGHSDFVRDEPLRELLRSLAARIRSTRAEEPSE